MPLPAPHATDGRRLTHARLLLALVVLLVSALALADRRLAHTGAARQAAAVSGAYDRALRMREALEGRSARERTRRDYDRLLDTFRAVYRADPHGPHADATMIAVAELLAAEGRLFEDRQLSLEAIEQYQSLRRQKPASTYRYSALLTEGEIYEHDLGDRTAARSIFAQFLQQYPQNALAGEARRQLKKSRAGPPPRLLARGAVASAADGRTRAHQNAVLDAARGAQQPASALPTRTQAAQTESPAVRAQTQTARPAALEPGFLPSTLPDPGRGRLSPAIGTLVEKDLPSNPPTRAEPSQPALSEAALNATPPPARRGKLPLVTGVRHWSTSVYTRVAIDLDSEVRYEASRVPNPDRILFDLHGAKLSPELIGKAVTVTDGGFLQRVRAAQFSGDMVRVVLDVNDVSEYSAFFLPNPSRLIIDIHGRAGTPAAAAIPAQLPAGLKSFTIPIRRTPVLTGTQAPATEGSVAAASPSPATRARAGTEMSPSGSATAAAQPISRPRTAPAARPQADSLGDIATLDRQPDTVRATHSPTTAPVAASVADTTPVAQPGTTLAPAPDLTSRRPRSSQTQASAARAHGITPADTLAPAIHATAVPAATIRTAAPTSTGERSMVRALGLKIGRIVVDAGHGGHDSGTLGPGGIEEKDVVLDVALRLGRLLKLRLGADVIYTRDDDTFIPLETRTAIANKAQADLFISVHANSSQDAGARGVETYYLNFTSSADALEVAARENAVSDQSIHQLSDLVKKITLQDKISESREFANDIEQSLYAGLEPGNAGLKDRGVKKAPFVVLIGANMPSILAEISFLTNPEDARQLRDGEYRQRIAESLYRGVAKYIGSLSGVRLAEGASRPAGQ